MRLVAQRRDGEARRPARRVRPPGAAAQRARPARRADRPRTADQEAAGRGSRREGERRQHAAAGARARWRRRGSSSSRTTCCRRSRPRRTRSRTKKRHAQAQAAAGNLRPQARAPPAADIKVLEIRRDRADTNMRQAESNAERMLVTSPLPRRRRHQDDVEERRQHDRVRGRGRSAPGAAGRRSRQSRRDARARAGQPGRHATSCRIGQPVRVGLDAYPGAVVQRHRRPDLADRRSSRRCRRRCATSSCWSLVNGAHPNLMPDLTASLDVELERIARRAGRAARRRRSRRRAGLRARAARRHVSSARTCRSAPLNTHEAVVDGGLAGRHRPSRATPRGRGDAMTLAACRPRAGAGLAAVVVVRRRRRGGVAMNARAGAVPNVHDRRP